MKPFVLQNERIEWEWPDAAARVKRVLEGADKYLGEVDPMAVGQDDPLLVRLLQVGNDHGLSYKHQHFYVGSSYLPINGSVPWHEDQGIGLVLNWMVHSMDLEGYQDSLNHNRCHLLTRHGQLQIGVGDIFVFNGNVGHAWISNSKCMLVQTTVSASRRKLRES